MGERKREGAPTQKHTRGSTVSIPPSIWRAFRRLAVCALTPLPHMHLTAARASTRQVKPAVHGHERHPLRLWGREDTGPLVIINYCSRPPRGEVHPKLTDYIVVHSRDYTI